MKPLEVILQKIEKDGPISFAEFMHLALFAPNVGYYSSNTPKFGKDGDFITAPELTPLFGYTLANQCRDIFLNMDTPNIFEFGAGSGKLCVDILRQLGKNNSLPQNYYILEVSAHLKQRQKEYIEAQIPEFAHLVNWVSTWPKITFDGVVIANEVLDAMPVHRFLQTENGLFEFFIDKNSENELVEVLKPMVDERLISHLTKFKHLYPYQSEVNLFIDDWIAECFTMLNRGVVFIIDYGFPEQEYYHPDRKLGTLMCHFRHKSNTNPLINVGEQDITAHVNFTHVAEAASRALFHVAGFCSQGSFLLANGLLNFLDEISDEIELSKQKQKVKQLVLPNEMGELFKVMALTKDFNEELNGFKLQDRRMRL